MSAFLLFVGVVFLFAVCLLFYFALLHGWVGCNALGQIVEGKGKRGKKKQERAFVFPVLYQMCDRRKSVTPGNGCLARARPQPKGK